MPKNRWPKTNIPAPCAAEDTNWGRELSSAVVRVGAGVLMVHNGLDKLADPEGFAKFVVEPYSAFSHTTTRSFVTWTYLAAGLSRGAAGLTLGFLTRLSALSLFSTMGLSVYHVAQSGLEGFPVEWSRNTSTRTARSAVLPHHFYFVVNGGGALPGQRAQEGRLTSREITSERARAFKTSDGQSPTSTARPDTSHTSRRPLGLCRRPPRM